MGPPALVGCCDYGMMMRRVIRFLGRGRIVRGLCFAAVRVVREVVGVYPALRAICKRNLSPAIALCCNDDFIALKRVRDTPIVCVRTEANARLVGIDCCPAMGGRLDKMLVRRGRDFEQPPVGNAVDIGEIVGFFEVADRHFVFAGDRRECFAVLQPVGLAGVCRMFGVCGQQK